jgi:AcrR family transcriptional regulator
MAVRPARRKAVRKAADGKSVVGRRAAGGNTATGGKKADDVKDTAVPSPSQRTALKPSAPQRGALRPAKPQRDTSRHGAPQPSLSEPSPPQRKRAAAASPRRQPVPARREAILAAALEEFSAQGFSAARLDDVARRAGVAKGTIYLYFRDKDALFEELIRSTLSPAIGAMELAMRDERPVRQILDTALDVFVNDIYGTARRDVIRLVISEGGRFPHLAEFYYREVLSRIFGGVGALLQRAAARGELKSEAVTRFPQLVGAPAIVAIIWNNLFERFAPLDVRGMMRAQLELIFTEARQP